MTSEEKKTSWDRNSIMDKQLTKSNRKIAVGREALGGGQGSRGSLISCLGFVAAGSSL